MTWGRGVAITALTLVIGLGLGILAEPRLRDRPAQVLPEPIAAGSPSVPPSLDSVAAPDPTTLAPLSTGLTYQSAVLGAAPFTFTLDVPKGWEAVGLDVAEVRWTPPGDPEDTHSLRVERVVSQRQTSAYLVDSRIEDLGEALGVFDLQILDKTDSSLTFSYLNTRQRRRLQMINWVSPTGSGLAEVEVSVVGRETDVPGLRKLLKHVSNSLA